MNKWNEIDSSVTTLTESKLIDLILYGSDKFDVKKNHNILMCTIKFIKDSKTSTKTGYNFFRINVKRIRVFFMCIFYIFRILYIQHGTVVCFLSSICLFV